MPRPNDALVERDDVRVFLRATHEAWRAGRCASAGNEFTEFAKRREFEAFASDLMAVIGRPMAQTGFLDKCVPSAGEYYVAVNDIGNQFYTNQRLLLRLGEQQESLVVWWRDIMSLRWGVASSPRTLVLDLTDGRSHTVQNCRSIAPFYSIADMMETGHGGGGDSTFWDVTEGHIDSSRNASIRFCDSVPSVTNGESVKIGWDVQVASGRSNFVLVGQHGIYVAGHSRLSPFASFMSNVYPWALLVPPPAQRWMCLTEPSVSKVIIDAHQKGADRSVPVVHIFHNCSDGSADPCCFLWPCESFDSLLELIGGVLPGDKIEVRCSPGIAR